MLLYYTDDSVTPKMPIYYYNVLTQIPRVPGDHRGGFGGIGTDGQLPLLHST